MLLNLWKFIKFYLLLYLPLSLRRRLPKRWRKVFKSPERLWRKTRIGENYFWVNLSERKRVDWYFNEVADGEELNAITPHLTHHTIFFDVGAHIGLFTIFAAHLCKSVHAFEPEREVFDYLSRNIHLNNSIADKVTANQQALSDKEGYSPLYIYDITVFSSLGHNSIRGKILKKEVVSTTTLDSYCKKHAVIPTFIKIDVEGFEGYVLRGGIQTLTRHSPMILCELAEENYNGLGFKTSEVRNFLTSLGYQEVQRVNHINFLFRKEA